MPENDQGKQKPTVSNDNHEETIGPRGSTTVSNPGDTRRDGEPKKKTRGDAVRAAGNKVHGDMLEGMIPDAGGGPPADGDDGDDGDDESGLK